MFRYVSTLTLGLIALVAAAACSLSVGISEVSVFRLWQILMSFDADISSHRLIMELRLPRLVAALLIGASLAVSGTLMQGLTRNPIASPGLMGLNAGAAFALACVLSVVPGASYTTLVLWSFAGAGLGSMLTYGVASMSRHGMTPIRLVLAGTAVTALLSSLSSGVAIISKVAQELSYWFAGGLAGMSWRVISAGLPWAIVGLVIAQLMGRSLTALSLGEETAKGLGQRLSMIKIAGVLLVLLLAGTSVAVAGPVGFIGLIIPHITRALVGQAYQRILPCSAVLGALFVVICDMLARIVNAPAETPIGVITAILGVPVFLYLTRGGKGVLR